MSDSVPIGYRFCPTDYELVYYYLYRKVNKKLLPCDSVVEERNLYGESEPWDIFNINGSCISVDNDVIQYFFTKLKKRSETDSRIDRTTGKGTWKGQDSGREIFDLRRGLVGFKKNFVYEYNKGSTENNGRWIMHEYRLDNTLRLQAKEGEGEYVLCRIRKKGVLQEARSEVEQGNSMITALDLPSTFDDLYFSIFPSRFLNRETIPFNNIPIGYRFIPTDYELIFYLYKKITKNPLASDNAVREKNLYDIESEPWDIFDDSDSAEEVQYFFTKLKKRSEKRIDRKIGKGTWKGQDSGRKICDDQGGRIGFRKNFVYENKKSENNGRWIMYEYRLDENLLLWIRTQLNEKEEGEEVICRIRKKEGLRESSSEVVKQGNSIITISDEPITVAEIDMMTAEDLPTISDFSNDGWINACYS